jgi:transcriptional regulator with XRE-family HTH domain
MNKKNEYIKKIKFLMFSNELNQKKLAEKTGLTTSYVSRILSGKTKPSLKIFNILSKSFSVPIVWFFQEENILDISQKKLTSNRS